MNDTIFNVVGLIVVLAIFCMLLVMIWLYEQKNIEQRDTIDRLIDQKNMLELQLDASTEAYRSYRDMALARSKSIDALEGMLTRRGQRIANLEAENSDLRAEVQHLTELRDFVHGPTLPSDEDPAESVDEYYDNVVEPVITDSDTAYDAIVRELRPKDH